MKKTILLISLFFVQLAFTQNNKQNIRGAVIDKLSHTPLIGANVQITNSPGCDQGMFIQFKAI